MNENEKEHPNKGQTTFKIEVVLEDEKKKVKIFNNKKNNNLCSALLKSVQEEEKDLYMLPYVKKKENVNKTLNTIGSAHGISYPVYSVMTGTSKNYLSIIRDDDKKTANKKSKLRKNKKNDFIKVDYENEPERVDKNSLKEMLGY